jgi:phosphoribosylaminoimidazolecarboxamide formyltransferase/IMP cyclohydrolase
LKKYALISVYDKTGIIQLARVLTQEGYNIIATGKTASFISKEGIEVTPIEEITGFPEAFEGRVKTLHPKVFGGILHRRDNKEDLKQVAEQGFPQIDIVCVNLYPFIETVAVPGVSEEQIIENIDIGGPSLIRAAAKNYKHVSVLTNPSQYQYLITRLPKVPLALNEQLARAAFQYTANYDSHIAEYFSKKSMEPKDHFRLDLPKSFDLRYGENPHQKAAVYGSFNDYFKILHGKELSFNNILDLSAAIDLLQDLEYNSCAIIKHNNPAGAATGSGILDAFTKALKCDPVSAFGGIVVFNNEVDEATALKLNEIFLEIICAPSFSAEALTILKKKKDRRLLQQLKSTKDGSALFKQVPGGILVQDPDSIILNRDQVTVVTDCKPSDKEMEDLVFAMTIAKHTKSNAIVFVKDKAALAVGAGQMSRVDSCKIAVMKAKENNNDLSGSVAASDAYFPFADGLLEIVKAGAVSVIQPGGSVRDNEAITAANENNISMVFTGIRHFKH